MIKSEKITIFAYLKLFLINNSLKNDLFHIKIWPKITEKWPFLASEIPEFPDFQYRNSVSVLDALLTKYRGEKKIEYIFT